MMTGACSLMASAPGTRTSAWTQVSYKSYFSSAR